MKKRFLVGEAFKNNLGKKISKGLNKLKVYTTITHGAAKDWTENENESKYTNSSSVNKHLNS